MIDTDDTRPWPRSSAAKLAKNNVMADGFSPTMAAIWEAIGGNNAVGSEVPVSVNRLVKQIGKTRPAVTKAMLQLVARGFLVDETPDPGLNKPHRYLVAKPRTLASEASKRPDPA